MEIIDKYDEGTKLKVGDLIILKDTESVSYVGKNRLITIDKMTNNYKLVALDINEVIYYDYNSLIEIYDDYVDNIEKIIPAENLKLFLQ